VNTDLYYVNGNWDDINQWHLMMNQSGPWSVYISGGLPAGTYFIRARAIDKSGLASVYMDTSTIIVDSGSISDTTRPTVVINISGNRIMPVCMVDGYVSSPTAPIDSILISVFNVDSLKYYYPDGSWNSAPYWNTRPGAPGPWSLNITGCFRKGNYRIEAKALDGNHKWSNIALTHVHVDSGTIIDTTTGPSMYITTSGTRLMPVCMVDGYVSSPTAPIDSILISVFNVDSLKYYYPDGSWNSAPYWNTRPGAPGPWSLNITGCFRKGNYRIEAKALDGNHKWSNIALTHVHVDSGTVIDTTKPPVYIATRGVFTLPFSQINGNTNSSFYVDTVKLSIMKTDSLLYLGPNNIWSSQIFWHNLVPVASKWTLTNTLNRGAYKVIARVENITRYDSAFITIDTILPVVDTTGPVVYIQPRGMLSAPLTSVWGDANDQTGADTVFVSIFNRDSSKYYNTTNFQWGPDVIWNRLKISTPKWNLSLGSSIAKGNLLIRAYAVDRLGYRSIRTDSSLVSFDTLIANDTMPPKVVITSKGSYKYSPIQITGDAMDNVGIGSVNVCLSDSTKMLWYDGKMWVTTERWINLYNTMTGQSWKWSWPLSYGLKNGKYYISAYTTDKAGKRSITDTATLIIDSTIIPPSPINIADNNGYTNDKDPAVYINSIDISEMKIALINDTATAVWKLFQNRDSIDISMGGSGRKIIAMQFRKSSGEISPWMTDTTIYDITPPVITCHTVGTYSMSNWNGTVNGTVSDSLSGVREIAVFLKNPSGQFLGATAWGPDSFFHKLIINQGMWRLALPTSMLSQDGIYTITTFAKDNASNKVENVIFNFSYYNTLDARFTASVTSGIAPLAVYFTNASIGNIAQYKWDFGNGVSDTMRTPKIIYTEGGKFTVKLIISGITGADTMIMTEPVIVGDTAKPLPLTSIRAVALNCSTAVVSWEPSQSKDADSVRLCISRNGYPSTYTEGDIIRQVSASKATDTLKGFDPSGYTLQIQSFVKDTFGNWSLQSDLARCNVTLPDGVAPVNTIALVMKSVGDSSVLVTLANATNNGDLIQFAFGKELRSLSDSMKSVNNSVLTFVVNNTIRQGWWYAASALKDVSGNQSLIRFDSVYIANTPPVINQLGDSTILEGIEFNTQLTYRDLNNDICKFTIVKAPLELKLTADARLSWVADDKNIGENTIVYSCSDNMGGVTFDTIIITIKNVNEVPVAVIAAPDSILEKNSFEALIKITDPDPSDMHTITFIKKPDWITLNGMVLKGIPQNKDVGLNLIEVIVSDIGLLADTAVYTVNVINVNDPPIVASSVLPDTLIEKRMSVGTISFYDPDKGDSLIAMVPQPSWVKVDSLVRKTNELTAYIALNPMQRDTGVKVVELKVQDRSGAEIVFRKSIQILDANDPPVPPSITKRVSYGAVRFAATSFDDRDSSLIYHFELSSVASAIIERADSTRSGVFTVYPLLDGDYICKVYAKDNAGLKSENTFDTVNIRNASVRIWKDTNWAMVSIPYAYPVSELKNTELLFHWDELSPEKAIYSFYKHKSEITAVTPGMAYWRKGSLPDTIKLTKEQLPTAPATVTLAKQVSGWNQISSPYNYPVTWPRPEDVLWKWNALTNDYEEARGVIEPWQGYWIRSDAGVVALDGIPLFVQPTLAKSKKSFFADKGNWMMQLSLVSEQGRDEENRFGFNDNAADGLGKEDIIEPPRMSGNAYMYFTNSKDEQGTKLATDVRKNWNSVNIFEIAIVGKKGTSNTISFGQNLASSSLYMFVANGDSIESVENVQSINISMEKDVEYRTIFVTDQRDFIRRIPLKFLVENPFPNPFKMATKLNYTIPYRWDSNGKLVTEPTRVKIRIYDAMGRVIRDLVDRKMIPGNYTLQWDGKSSSGKRMASGYYFCMITAETNKSIKKMTILR
jgi:PKD repeat protein